MAWDDPRLPGVTLGPQPLRLNSLPVPAAFLAAGVERGDRVEAAREWLGQACGDYAVRRVGFIARYLEFVAAELQGCALELDRLAVGFDGLYRAQDWMWSALRPLPRAWVRLADGPAMADIAFWDGRRLFAADLGCTTADALRAAGVAFLPAGELHAVLPDSFRAGWRTQTLPASPFRRPRPTEPAVLE